MAEPTVAAPATQPESAAKTEDSARLLTGKVEEKPSTEAAPTQKTEAKPEGQDKKAADASTDNKDSKAADVPEQFSDWGKLKLPEGTIVDEPLKAEFMGWAKDLKLTNDQAQKAADLHLKTMSVFAQKQAQEFQAQQEEWFDELYTDKEIGGAKLEKEVLDGRKIINLQVSGVNTQRLKADLNRTGLDKQPDLVRLMAFLGKLVGPDGVIIGKLPDTGPKGKDMASVWYPNSPNSEQK